MREPKKGEFGWLPDHVKAERAAGSNAEATSEQVWPEGVSDGLSLPCSHCGRVPVIDYTVDDEFWEDTVPKAARLGVVCLDCLVGMDASAPAHLLQIQVTGRGITVICKPTWSHVYEPRR